MAQHGGDEVRTIGVDRRVLKTRAAIHGAFRKLVKELGLGKVTVSALAREADIDRKTFYLHYDSIDDLVDREADVLVDGIIETIDDERLHEDPEGQIRLTLARVNETLREDLELYEYMARSLSMDFVISNIQKAIWRYLDRNGLDTIIDADENAVLRARFYLAGTVSVYGEWLCSDRSRPLEDVTELVANALISAHLVEARREGEAAAAPAPAGASS